MNERDYDRFPFFSQLGLALTNLGAPVLWRPLSTACQPILDELSAWFRLGEGLQCRPVF